MSLIARIQEDVKDAMRSKAKERLQTLRLITAAIKQKEVDERIELDDAGLFTRGQRLPDGIKHSQRCGNLAFVHDVVLR